MNFWSFFLKNYDFLPQIIHLKSYLKLYARRDLSVDLRRENDDDDG